MIFTNALYIDTLSKQYHLSDANIFGNGLIIITNSMKWKMFWNYVLQSCRYRHRYFWVSIMKHMTHILHTTYIPLSDIEFCGIVKHVTLIRNDRLSVKLLS